MIRRYSRLMMVTLVVLALATGTLTVQSMDCCHSATSSTPCQDDPAQKQCVGSYCAACFAPVQQISHEAYAAPSLFSTQHVIAYNGFTVRHTPHVMERPPKVLG